MNRLVELDRYIGQPILAFHSYIGIGVYVVWYVPLRKPFFFFSIQHNAEKDLVCM